MHLCLLCCFEFCSVLDFSMLQFYHPYISWQIITYTIMMQSVFTLHRLLYRDFFFFSGLYSIISWGPKRTTTKKFMLLIWNCECVAPIEAQCFCSHGSIVVIDKSAVLPARRWLWLGFCRGLVAVTLKELCYLQWIGNQVNQKSAGGRLI